LFVIRRIFAKPYNRALAAAELTAGGAAWLTRYVAAVAAQPR
jgi:hypothetical protein